MGNNSVSKFIFRLSRFPVYRGSVLGRFYCIIITRSSFDHITQVREDSTSHVVSQSSINWIR